MFVFHYKTFVGQLQVDEPYFDGIPSESPVLIFFNQKEDLTKHEILKRFNNLLQAKSISWLRPFRSLTNEWVIDLKELKSSFKILENTEYLKGKVTVEPEYFQRENRDEYSDEVISIETSLKLAIYPDEIYIQSSVLTSNLNDELKRPLDRFFKDFSKPHNCGFLMMKYEDTPMPIELVKIIKEHFAYYNYNILRADDKWYSDDLLSNIKTYMHGCSFGVALFDRINSNYFNPNVSLEIGYMMSLDKPILFLKEKTLQSLHTDLVGKLYAEFDFQDAKNTLTKRIDKWLTDNEMI
jgi:hypothetical protein